MQQLADTHDGKFHRETLVARIAVIEVTFVGYHHRIEEEVGLAAAGLRLVASSLLGSCLDEFQGRRILCHHKVAQVSCPSSDEVLGVEATANRVVEHHQGCGQIALQGIVGNAEERVRIEQVEVVDGGLVGHIAAGERGDLVEDRKRITHTAIGLACNDLQGTWFHADTLLPGNIGQLLNDVLRRDTLEVIGLATAQDRGQDLLLLGGAHHEDGVLRRLLQRLEECVECSCRKHMYLIDDEHLVLADLRRYLHLVDQFADVIDRVVRRCIEFIDVVAALLLERLTALAFVAGLAVLCAMLAVDGLGKDTRTRSLAHTTWATEEVGMRQFATGNRILQGLHQGFLPHHRLKGGWTIFSCRNNIVCHRTINN